MLTWVRIFATKRSLIDNGRLLRNFEAHGWKSEIRLLIRNQKNVDPFRSSNRVMGKDHLDQVHTIISDQAKELAIASGSHDGVYKILWSGF